MRWSLRVPILAFLASIPLVLEAQSSPVTSVEKVGEGIWMAQTDKGSNAGWFLLGDEVIAVDAGSDDTTGKALLAKIQETAGKPVRYVVITHAHRDHAGGVGAFVAAGARVICQENAASAVTTLVPPGGGRAGILAMSERLGFVGGPRRAAIYFLGAAHSNGDLFLFLPDDKVLFAGDLALGKRVPYMQSADVDPKGWENILGRLVQMDVDKIVPGHGTLTTGQTLTATLTYIQKVNELAGMIVAENVSEDLIEARLHQPNSGIEPEAVTPELIANVRAVARALKAKAARTTPTAKPTAKPAAKPTPKAPAKKK